MATLTIRNLPEPVHRALRLRAAGHGRSTEAEVREILALAALPSVSLKIGTELRNFALQLEGKELQFQRDASPIQAAEFE
jgi:antitoxin FitA